MNATRSIRLIAATPLIALLSACGGTAGTEDKAPASKSDAPPEIAERQDNYEKIGDAFKAIRGQLEGGAPDLAIIEASAKDINERAGKITALFPKGTSVDDGFDTEALPAIWEKPDEFKAAAQKLIDESAKLAQVAKGGDAAAIGAQAKAMGGTCKNCHDSFRAEDE